MNRLRAGISLLLAVALLLCGTPVLAAVDPVLEGALERAAEYVLAATPLPRVGSIGGEWAVLGLARSGCDIPQRFYNDYIAAVENTVRASGGVLHERKYTEYARVAIALTAVGADPSDVAGYNLLAPLGDYEGMLQQGINGPIWALIALDCGGYDMPLTGKTGTQATRQLYVDRILSLQRGDGGWSLSGSDAVSDPDVTAMALQALVRYQGQVAVKTAVKAALEWLSAAQHSSGGYSSWGVENVESTAQVIVALCALGINLEDSRFVKSGGGLLDNLLAHQLAGGGFLHTVLGTAANQMASEQGLYALSAAWRAQTGRGGLYDMAEVAYGLPDRHPDIRRVPVSAPGTSFSDIKGHAAQAAIEALASRGIIAGMGEGLFAPGGTLTRAQFSAIIVRALGLEPAATGAFRDVAASAWYAPYVGAAHRYGLISGRGEGVFDPHGNITRQEAAVLAMRAAALCGMETGLDEAAVRSTLALFDDRSAVADWARQGLVFCCNEGLLDRAGSMIRPEEAILRGETAVLIHRLLHAANLM